MTGPVSSPQTSLIRTLPPVQGNYRENMRLSELTWLRVGGAAEVLYKPVNHEDLALFMKERPPHIPVQPIGVGSNLLVRDGGIPGVSVRLGGKSFNHIRISGNRIVAGAAALDMMVAKKAAQAGLGGLGFLAGIPGTIGGALAMNAGAHGGQTSDCLTSALVVTNRGEIRQILPEDIGHSYRSSQIPDSWFFVEAEFTCQPEPVERLEAELLEIQYQRLQSQPVKSCTGGSTFKNPPDQSAWKLIDMAGCRGMRVGNASMSELHCNFMINEGGATACDLETLGERVRAKVKEKSGIELEWEIKRLGLKTVTSPNRKGTGNPEE